MQRLVPCILASLLMGAVAARGELVVSHLRGEARAVRISEANGGVIRFTAEARIGTADDWRLGIRRLRGDPPTATAGFNDWPNGSPVPFILRYDGRRTVSLSLIQDGGRPTVAYESDSLADLAELFVSVLAANVDTSIVLTGLRLDGMEVRDAPAAASAGVPGQDVLRLQGGRLAGGFTLTGALTLTWRGVRPQGSDLHALFWGTKVKQPANKQLPGVVITAPAAESILATGTPTITAAFTGAGPAIVLASIRLLLDEADRTGQAEVSATGLTFTPSTQLPEGKHTVRVTVRDRAGNEGQATESFTTDTVPPAIAFVAPAQVVPSNPTPVIRLTYSDATSGLDLRMLRVTLDGDSIDSICVANLASSVCLPTSIAAGSHTLTATIRDQAGNLGTASFGFTLTLEGDNP